MIKTDKKDALDPAIKKFAENLCRKEKFPMLIVDDMLCCVFSPRPKLVPVGTLLSCFVSEPVVIPLKKEKDVLITLNEVSYCARFIPINKKYSFCQLLSVSEILTLASFTNLYPVVDARIFMLKKSADDVRRYIDELSEILPPKIKSKCMRILDADAEISKLEYMLNRLSDYVYMAFSPNKDDNNDNDNVIDAHDMLNVLIEYSNNILAAYDRHLEFLSDNGVFNIRIGQRYAVTALIHAMQNALIYSPKNNDLIVSLTRTVRDDEKYIVVQIVNSLDSFTENPDLDLVYPRCGLGIPLIKKFVERADGEFYFEKNDVKARMGILIPEFIPKDTEKLIFKCDSFTLKDTEKENIMEMLGVVSSLSKNKNGR